jgi:transcriptional regulator CtsR
LLFNIFILLGAGFNPTNIVRIIYGFTGRGGYTGEQQRGFGGEIKNICINSKTSVNKIDFFAFRFSYDAAFI